MKFDDADSCDQAKNHRHAIPWNEVITCIGFLLIYMLDLSMHQLVRIVGPKQGRCVTQDSSIDAPRSTRLWKKELARTMDRTSTTSTEFNRYLVNVSPDSTTEPDSIRPAPDTTTNTHNMGTDNKHTHHFDYHIDGQGKPNKLNLVLKMHACNTTATPRSRLVLPAHRCELADETVKPQKLSEAVKVNQRSIKPIKAIQTIGNGYGTVSSTASASASSSSSAFAQRESMSMTTLTTSAATYHDTSRMLSLFNCLMIVGGLSTHAVFEGFAIGMQREPLLLYQLSTAICLHKLLISFVLGLNLMCETGRLKDTALGLAVFCSMTPIGLLFGAIWINSISVDSHSFAVPAANALATGTLIYVTFFELRPQLDHHSNRQSCLHFVAAFLGFVTILFTLLL